MGGGRKNRPLSAPVEDGAGGAGGADEFANPLSSSSLVTSGASTFEVDDGDMRASSTSANGSANGSGGASMFEVDGGDAPSPRKSRRQRREGETHSPLALPVQGGDPADDDGVDMNSSSTAQVCVEVKEKCRAVINSMWMEPVVMFAIIVNTVLLSIENPATTLPESMLDWFLIADLTLAAIFTIEMLIRVGATGFYSKADDYNDGYPGYINDPWNQLDFVIVLSAWVNAIVLVSGIEIGINISTVRALRVLRVLKAFKTFKGIRVILSTIAIAMPHSMNVVGFIAFLFLVCGIVGLQLFRGTGLSACSYGGFRLNELIAADKVVLDPLVSFVNRTTPELSYEYPIGIGVWYTYCNTDLDCPLYEVDGVWNRTQTCEPSLNPGRTFLNFDTIFGSWVALFINMSNLYWWETAHRIADSNQGLGSSLAWTFGAFNVFALTYVSVNMFVAVITTVFIDVRSTENPGGGLTSTQTEDEEKRVRRVQEQRDDWVAPGYFLPALGGEGPYIEVEKPQRERAGLIWHVAFEPTVLCFIFLNTIVLGAEHHDETECLKFQADKPCQAEDFILYMRIANYAFNFIFTVEAVIKILGMGFKAYISPSVNRLDFLIVVLSMLDMLAEFIDSTTESTATGDLPMSDKHGIFKVFRVFRIFRVLRVVRVLYRNENLKRVLTTVLGSGQALANLGLFIFFSVLLFAIAGMHLLGGHYHPLNPNGIQYGDNNATLFGRLVGGGHFDIRHEGAEVRVGYDVLDLTRKGLIPRRNFEDFPRAFMLSFQIMTGDDWVNQMHDYMEVHDGSPIVPLFFFSCFAFCNFIVLSLFIAVILENFEIAEAKKMAMQVEQSQTKARKAERRKRRPKITFVHRLVWLCGGTGKRPASLWSISDSLVRGTDLDENGKILAGTKWYNDDNVLFLFGPDNSLRKAAAELSRNKIFDSVVLVAIILGSAILAVEGPKDSLRPQVAFICDRINDCLFVIFLAELLIKVVGFGFIFTESAYLKDPWNKIDFAVILNSCISYLGGSTGAVRLLRCFRPLRIINRNESMRVIISAVVESMTVNVGVLALATLGLLIFAIIGVSILAGKMYSCNCSHVFPADVDQTAKFDVDGGWSQYIDGHFHTDHDYPNSTVIPVRNKQDCLGLPSDWLDIGNVYTKGFRGDRLGVDPNFPNAVSACYWDNRPYNFDTVFNAMMSLFSVSTLAGWTDIMEVGVDSTGIGNQPVAVTTQTVTIYFIVYILVMSFFVTNLFIGVLIDFIGTSDGTSLLTENQQKLVDMKRFQRLHKPTERQHPPGNNLRDPAWDLAQSGGWSLLSNGVIVINIIVNMCEYEGQSDSQAGIIDLLNNICLLFFTFEVLLKLFAYFPTQYWQDGWNRFDTFVVVISWAAIIFELRSVQALRAVRALRIALVLKNAHGIRMLFETIMLSFYPSINISVLLLLLYSLFAIGGMQMFGHMPMQDVECAAPGAGADFGKRILERQKMNMDQQPYCEVGTRQDDPDISSWFSGFAGGTPGQMLVGLNRQYTHHSSFRNFASAMGLLFQCAAGQDWKFVMYAVGGEPGLSPNAGGTFMYFFLFFFLSNYILLNLFVAVILGNFAATMREHKLDIGEHDFENFKYFFRDLTDDAAPEMLPFHNLWELLTKVGLEGKGADGSDGKLIESGLAPFPTRQWAEEEEELWTACSKLASTKKIELDPEEFETTDLKELMNRLYYADDSPIAAVQEPGSNFSEYWDVLIATPSVFPSCGGDIPASFFQPDGWSRRWDAIRQTIATGEGNKKGWAVVCSECGPVPLRDLRAAIESLRFRGHYKRVVYELAFHAVEYDATLAGASKIKYDQLLQSLVNVRMGDDALSLDEQIARGKVPSPALSVAKKLLRRTSLEDGRTSRTSLDDQDGLGSPILEPSKEQNGGQPKANGKVNGKGNGKATNGSYANSGEMDVVMDDGDET